MSKALSTDWMAIEQDQRISDAVKLEQARLRNFIRKRVADESDAEDILQDVFYELVEAYRMLSRSSRLARGYSAWHGIGSPTSFEREGQRQKGTIRWWRKTET